LEKGRKLLIEDLVKFVNGAVSLKILKRRDRGEQPQEDAE
jgi:hypothetical protein